MGTQTASAAPIAHADRFYIGGEWVAPSSDATIAVVDSHTEEVYFRVAEAQAADVDRAVAAAREAFDHGPWPRLSHGERADVIRALGAALAERADDIAEIWPREAGVLAKIARASGARAPVEFDPYAALAETFPWEEPVTPTAGGAFGLLVREPVGVVGAIIPWNVPLTLMANKVSPALLAGCTVVLKMSPEAPGLGYLLAEAAAAAGLPAGVLNVLTADREVSELLVTDPRVDKITFTGSTAAGRRIGALCGGRIARFTLELGGKSAAVILDDADVAAAATQLARSECFLAGQVCSSLTRVIATPATYGALAEALGDSLGAVRVGDPFDRESQMGPLAAARHRDRVEGYIAKGIDEGARLVVGGKRPAGLDRGWYVEPTLFADVDNRSTLAQEEIFGPVLSLIRADDEEQAVELANDTIYGLNASVFTPDADRARAVAAQLRSGTVGQNAFRTDFGLSFGGFKQSGIGREGVHEGVWPFVETKTVILDGPPARYR
jgi:acyl-CoA reductase-like NAD-dependent aldehyde dehydrogenase